MTDSLFGRLETIAWKYINKLDYPMLYRALLSASYAYYHKDSNLLADTTYDTVCKTLYDNWDEAEPLIRLHSNIPFERDALLTGSLFMLKESDYPSICRDAVKILLEQEVGNARTTTTH